MIEIYKLFESDINITCDTIMCFDIEVSSFWVDNGNVVEYSHELSDEYLNSCDKGSLVYIFQFSINDTIYYSRNFKDFELVCDYIKEHFKGQGHPYIFIHNASYETQFILNLDIGISKMFAREIRKPMKYLINEFIEVRCSYMLTNLPLATWGKQLGIPKLVGQLDYNKIRTPLTDLTQKELEYCEYDIKIMIKGLSMYLKDYKHISKIPLTSTGEVRRPVKALYKNDMKYHRRMTALVPNTADEEKILRQVFNGGDAKGNKLYISKVGYNLLHVDETSAYPSIIVRKKFPLTPFIRCSTNNLDYDKYSYILYVRFKGLRLKKGCTLSYISIHRAISTKNVIADNGRIWACDYCSIYLTELDYITALRIYDYDNIEIVTARRSLKGYLDTRYVKYVLKLFKDKTTLKGSPIGSLDEELYHKQKNKFNSLYGLMVQAITQPTITLEGNEWECIPQSKKDIQEEIDNLKSKPYKNYTAYQVGVWVTSWARFMLWSAILELPNDSVYYFDTDSIFFKKKKEYYKIFERLNSEIVNETDKAMRYHNIDGTPYIQTTKKGEVSILGTWTYEPNIKRFKTLGSKKYLCEEIREDGSTELILTVSGLPKKAVSSLNGFDDFTDGFLFDREHCGKNLSHYIDGDNPKVVIDGFKTWERYGINIRPTTYKLGATTDYKATLQLLKKRGEI